MCGIFAVFNVRKAAELTVIGLHGNQHRARDYSGIVSSDGIHSFRERGPGLAHEVFDGETLERLHGMDAVGHLRYPTVHDSKGRDNIQPIVGRYAGKWVAIAHNGNLTNVDELKTLIPTSMSTSMDTEYILRLLEEVDRGHGNSSQSIAENLASVFGLLKGSFSLAILLPDQLIAVQDPSGNRPLSIGKLNGGYCVTSETCALPNVEAEYLFDVKPGTMVFITKDGIQEVRFAEPVEKKCRFEGVYYSHPGSNTFGESVAAFRMRLGQALEEHVPALGADIVTPVPDSANFIAMGYGQSGRSGVYLPVIFRHHNSSRTFIAATQALRDEEVARKFGFSPELIEGKSVVVVDDSIVRGTTLPKIIRMLWRLKAKEVHVRIGSPPIAYPCVYGINTPTREELISSARSPAKICEKVQATSLEFLPLEVLKGLSPDPESYCFSCMTGKYW